MSNIVPASRNMVTPHFSVEEFICHDGTPYPVDNVEDGTGVPTGWIGAIDSSWLQTRLMPLCLTLEAIRAEAGGKSITIDSGYRDEAYDQKIYEAHVAAVGDDGLVAPASTSIHPKGGAADIIHATLSSTSMFNLVLKMFEAGKLPYLGGVGHYPKFIHVDVRTRTKGGVHLAIWGGERPHNVA